MVFTNGRGSDVALMADPLLDLTSNRSLTVDARSAKPLSVTVPHASARGVNVDVGGGSLTPNSPFRLAMNNSGFDGLYTGQFGPEQKVVTFTS